MEKCDKLGVFLCFSYRFILIKVLPASSEDHSSSSAVLPPLEFVQIMKGHSEAKYRMMGILLHMCKDLRVRAFYHLTTPFSKAEGILAIKLAQQIAEEVGLIYMYMILPGFALHP